MTARKAAPPPPPPRRSAWYDGLPRGLLNTLCCLLGMYLLVNEALFRDGPPRGELIAAYMALIAGPVALDAVRRTKDGDHDG